MSLPFDETARMIGRRCLCLRVQRASRAIGRQFDDAFRAVGLNNWQFSLLMSLNRPSPLPVTRLAEELAMDRTTTTKNLKPLERRGLVEIRRDDQDARVKRVILTEAGRALLTEAVQHWTVAQQKIEASLRGTDLASFHTALEAITQS